jgi:hypothetical protein
MNNEKINLFDWWEIDAPAIKSQDIYRGYREASGRF